MDYFKKSNWSKNWGLRFNLGLVISLSLTLVAFEWKSYEEQRLIDLGRVETSEEQVIEIPNTIQTPPPPPMLVQPVIIEVENEEIEEEIANFNAEVKIDEVVTAPVAVVKKTVIPDDEPVNDEPFITLEEGAIPDGGWDSFYKAMAKNLKYPSQARRMNVEGKVFVQFVVERDGSLTDVKVVKGIGAGCDEEAERVIKESKKWNAGKQRGRPVRQRMVIPITFKLG